MKSGVVYVRVRLLLNMDVEEEEAAEMVENMDYEFKDEKGLIADSEVMSMSQKYEDLD